MSKKKLEKKKSKFVEKDHASKKDSTKTSFSMQPIFRSKKKQSSKGTPNNLKIKQSSAEIMEIGSSIEDDYEDWWEETTDYINASDTFEREIWEKIRSTVSAGKLVLERLVAKCVKEEIPKRYKMTQGEFFGEFFGLKDYQVSKMVSRDRVRTLISETFMGTDYIKDALVDKISAFLKKDMSEGLLMETLEELYDNNNHKYPSVAQFESRVTSILTENECLSRLQDERESYLRNYDLNAVEKSQIEDCRGATASSIAEMPQDAILSAILTQLSAIQQSLKKLEGGN